MTNLDMRNVSPGESGHASMPANETETTMFNRRQTIGMNRREQENGSASGLSAGQTTSGGGQCVKTKNRPLSGREMNYTERHN